MKRYLLIIIVIICCIISLTGCKTKKKESSKDLSLEKGKITVVCKSGNLGDAVIKMKSTVTSNFDKNKNIMNYKVETIEENKDKKSYESRKKMYEDSYKQLKNTKDNVYDMIVDDSKKKITLITVIKNIDINTYGEEERKTYEIATYIKNYESGAYKCSITGITRKELGLK